MNFKEGEFYLFSPTLERKENVRCEKNGGRHVCRASSVSTNASISLRSFCAAASAPKNLFARGRVTFFSCANILNCPFTPPDIVNSC